LIACNNLCAGFINLFISHREEIMRKKAAIVVFACSMMIACIFIPIAQAAPSALNQAVARNLAASLRSDLQIADQQPELSPLVNSTYVLLDALEDALKNKDVDAMRFAVEQYAEEVQFFQAAAIDTQCALPLVISIGGKIPTLLGIVSGGGTPLCLFINLSNNIADIISSTLSYQICVVNGDSDNSTDNATLVQKQQSYKIFGFTTSVLNLAVCKRPIAASDFISLFFEFIGLIPKAT
jgi:hypothetical protein